MCFERAVWLCAGVPAPCDLKVERQLQSSVLISWSPPPGLPTADVNSYHVFLDGHFKTSVSGSERTKALLENLDLAKVSGSERTKALLENLDLAKVSCSGSSTGTLAVTNLQSTLDCVMSRFTSCVHALCEVGVVCLQPHQLSVRTVTNRGHSDDALQVISIGKGTLTHYSDVTVTLIYLF